MKKFSLPTLFASFFFVGKIPFAPGTWGTVAAVPFGLLIGMYGGAAALGAASVLIFILGCWASEAYMREANSAHDPKEIVIDEVAGMWLVMALTFSLTSLAVMFIAFRLCDILKPWPISWADRTIKGGFGVMVDDVLAAVFAVLLIYLFNAGLAYFDPLRWGP